MSCDQREDGSLVDDGFSPGSVYRFDVHYFEPYLIITNICNYVDDLNKSMHFIKSTANII